MEAAAVEEHGINQRLAKALSHPLRVKLLAVINECPSAPVELAHRLKANLPNVSYHVRELRKYGCIEPVKTEQVRGVTKTTYRACTRMLIDNETWAAYDRRTRSGISREAIGELVDCVEEAGEAGTLDSREDRHIINLRMTVDEQAWEEVSEIVADAYRRLADVEAKAANRGGDQVRANVHLLSYEAPLK